MRTITDKEQILEVLRGFIRKPKEQGAEFLYEICVAPGAVWNGWTVTPGGLQVIGARPFTLVSTPPTGEHLFDLTNSDSGYQRSIGQVRLADITSITLLK
jgi:hypothetical protein